MSTLRLSATSLDFRSLLRSLSFQASNGGTGTLNITSVTTDAPWLEAAPVSGTAPLTIEVSVGTEANPYSARFEVASGDSIGTVSSVDGEDGVRTVDFSTGLIVKEIVTVSDTRDEVIRHPLFNPDGSRASDETGYLTREEVREIPVQRLEVRCEDANGEIRFLSLDL